MPLSEIPPALAASGQDPPLLRVPPPGPLSRSWLRRLEQVECPSWGARRIVREKASGLTMDPIVYATATGSNVFDVDGNRYVDLAAGFGSILLGHGAPKTSQALTAQQERLWQALGDVYPSDAKIALMGKLATLYPEPRARVILGQTGADAITAALKTAVLATGRPGVMAFEGSYHGMSYAPLAASGLRPVYREPFREQLNPHVVFVPFPTQLSEIDQALRAARTALRSGNIGALLIEPVLGRGGCVPAPRGFLMELAQLTHETGALLIADEIWTGLGRAGAWLASVEEGVTPDLICLGKGLGGGLPISACIGSDEVMSAWAKGPGSLVHTATFHGAPLACSTALATLDAIRSEQLVERAKQVGQRWFGQLCDAVQPFADKVTLQGRGLMIGIKIAPAGEALGLMREMLRRGYLVLTGGMADDTLTLTPPLTIDEMLLEGFADTLCELLKTRLLLKILGGPYTASRGHIKTTRNFMICSACHGHIMAMFSTRRSCARGPLIEHLLKTPRYD